MPRFSVLLFLLLLLAVSVSGQHSVFKVEGTVHGYEHNESQGLLRKSKPTLLEGTLEDAHIKVIENGYIVRELNTDDKGLFSFELSFDALYQLIISKQGYNNNQLIIDTRAFPQKIKKGGYAFTGAEFVLNSYKAGSDSSLHKKLGRLHYNPSQEKFSLEGKSQQEPVGLFVATPLTDTPLELLQRAIRKNNEQLREYSPLPDPEPQFSRGSTSSKNVEKAEQPAKPQAEQEPSADGNENASNSFDASPAFTLNPLLPGIDEELIRIQEDAIRREKEQLLLDRLKSKSQEDSMRIAQREQQISLAEQEISHARLLITTQDEKLTAQRNSLYLMISLLVITSGLLLMVISHYRQKQKTTLLIESKNRQITDSISYARRIQQSILISENTICQFLPESFVFWQPKAIVSGDFYFIASTGSKYLVAAADCTGHGVPGAFMSLIGHRLLREIIIEKDNYDPAAVLEQLHTGIMDALQQSEGQQYIQDGMDIAVCLIDPQAHKLVYAGAMNPAYLLEQDKIQLLEPDLRSVGGKALRPESEGKKRVFSNKIIRYSPGSMLYMFTDGYMDQFGGEHDQKFNTRRFKKLLSNIYHLPAAKQKEIIAGTFHEWKEDYPQTDDVLLIGISLP